MEKSMQSEDGGCGSDEAVMRKSPKTKSLPSETEESDKNILKSEDIDTPGTGISHKRETLWPTVISLAGKEVPDDEQIAIVSTEDMAVFMKQEAADEADPEAPNPSALLSIKMEILSDEEKEEKMQEDDESANEWSASEKDEGESDEDGSCVSEPVEYVSIKEEIIDEEESLKVEEVEEGEYELHSPDAVALQDAREEETEEMLIGTDPLDLCLRNEDGDTETSESSQNTRSDNCCPHCKLLFVDAVSVQLHAKSCLQALSKKKFKCETCGAAVSSAASLRRHKQTHTGKRPHKCEVCEASFKRLSHLRDHKSSHTGERKHVCSTCGAAFTQLSNPRTHERHHLDGGSDSVRVRRLFRCEVCGAEFGYNSSLKMHLLNHTGERPFQCDVCKASFKQLQSLTVHKRRHTGERPFQCDSCGMTFAHLQGLRVHKRIHTGERPYKCDICDAAFTQLHSLTTHKRRHNDVRPYSCEVCNASFVTKDKMRYHIRIHTGEKPYACPTCGKAFTTASDLTRHKRIHVPKAKDGGSEKEVKGKAAAASVSLEVQVKEDSGRVEESRSTDMVETIKEEDP